MNTVLECWPKGSKRSEAVEELAEKLKASCEHRLKFREDGILRRALIANGAHPDYQNN